MSGQRQSRARPRAAARKVSQREAEWQQEYAECDERIRRLDADEQRLLFELQITRDARNQMRGRQRYFAEKLGLEPPLPGLDELPSALPAEPAADEGVR